MTRSTTVDEFLTHHPVSRRIGPLSAADAKKLVEIGTPAPIVEFLTAQGLAFFGGDFFATTLPHWHVETLKAANLKPSECFPFLRTALGTLIFWKKKKVVYELRVGQTKAIQSSWFFPDYLNIWLMMETATDVALDRDVYQKIAQGTATLGIDEYFAIEPRPTGAYKVQMGLTGEKPTKKYVARVVKMGAAPPAEEPKNAPAKKAAKPKDASGVFVDPNLKLAVLDALAQLGELELGDFEPADPEAADEKLRKKLLKLPITPAQLRAVKTLVWGGGMEIQHTIWQEWDGEDEYFDLTDLQGIEALENLQELSVISAMTVKDLSPLLGLKKLKKLQLPSSYAKDATVKALKKRGVTIG